MNQKRQTVLITGAARRIGAEVAMHLHSAGFDLALHYRESVDDVQQLAEKLNAQRANSVLTFRADLSSLPDIEQLTTRVINLVPNLTCVVNNASTFFPTTIGNTTESQWNGLFDVNLKAPYFIVQGLKDVLKENTGSVVNLTDIYADRPLGNHAVYSASKSGLISLSKSMASELAPDIRVNAIAPGAILWPENGAEQPDVLQRVPMARAGQPEDIAKAVLFLIQDANYITGQTITVDGGRSVVA